MFWTGVFEGIQSFFENVAFIPYDALRSLELESWLAANFMSWILLVTFCVLFIYWLLQLKDFNESTENTYTYKEDTYLE